MLAAGVNLQPYRVEYALETVKLWRRAFQRAMALEEQDRFTDLAPQLDFLSTLPASRLTVAMQHESSTIVGFMALEGTHLDQLYVHVDWQRCGIGTALLDLARQRSPDGLELFTFQRNPGAQAFYERQGFTAVAQGYAAREGNPWAESAKDLGDITYRWAP